MTTETTPDQNDEAETALRLHVGDGVFERGAAHYRDGHVGQLTTTHKRTTATVTGAGEYQVEVQRTPRGFEGHCSCPASEGFDFCQHCVALALALDARETQRAQAATGGPQARLKVYLDDLPREQLIQLIANAAHDLPDLNERLQLQADIAAGALDTRRARKIVTAAMPLRRIWQRPKVRRYFANAVSAMNGLLQVAPSMDSDTLLNVAEYALERYDGVLERVDDSDGNRFFLQDRLRALLAEALTKIDWPADQRAAYLLDRVLRDQRGLFDKGLDDLWKTMGDSARLAFVTEAEKRLDELNDGTAEDELFGLHRNRLIELLRVDATQRDDVNALIELDKANLRGSLDRYRLAGLYLRNGDLDAALALLDEADVRAHSGNHDHALRVAVHRARGEWSSAALAQFRLLLDQPSLPEYRDLEALAQDAGASRKILRDLNKALRAQLVTGNPRRSQTAALLAELAFEAGDTARAFALIVEHVTDATRLLDMAQWFEVDEPVRATQLIDCAVEATIAQKKNWAYKEIVSIIWSHRQTFDRLGPQVFASFVADLKVRHKAKRNLVALLEAAASE